LGVHAVQLLETLFFGERSPWPCDHLGGCRGEGAIASDTGSAEAYFAAHLFAYRHTRNNILAMWGLGEFASEGKPLAMVYGYNDELQDEPYGGGILFKPDAFYFDVLLYGKKFPALFERDIGMPVEHLWAIFRGLCKLAIDTQKADGMRLTPWGLITGTLPIPRDDILGGPLEKAARRELAESYPNRERDADLGDSIKLFVELATSPVDRGFTDQEADSAHRDSPRGRDWTAEDVRVHVYPYMIHGQDSHDLWVVDYLRTVPFIQGLIGKLRFSSSKTTTGSRQSDAYERTSVFDARLAEVVGEVPGVAFAFLENREDASLPNAKFYFDEGAADREIDLPLRVGEVLIAVQTWAREVDLRMFTADYNAMRRRWQLVKDKLQSTDKLYTDYLLGHPEGRQHMERGGLRYVLPVLCGPYAEPAVSLRPKDWLRPPVAVSSAEVGRLEMEKAVPRVLTSPELVDFLSTATEHELSAICERSGWKL
jgi:hypothetical protein